MEENYDYKEETKKWLKSRPTAGIRVGKEYQAVIPAYVPFSGPKREPALNTEKKEELLKPQEDIKEPTKKVSPVKGPVTKKKEIPKEETMTQKRTEAEPSTWSRGKAEEKDENENKKSKIDP